MLSLEVDTLYRYARAGRLRGLKVGKLWRFTDADVEQFLQQGQGLVEQEPDTTAWFGIRLGPTTFGIFDVFPDDDGRQAHLSGEVAQALMKNAGELYDEPQIQPLDVIASKLGS